ncbi:MAG: Ig-like domain-containing protein [Acidobacteriota bacterium]|nr:Ig-like domain-containing protein [Acidobacteriota bacterium]
MAISYSSNDIERKHLKKILAVFLAIQVTFPIVAQQPAAQEPAAQQPVAPQPAGPEAPPAMITGGLKLFALEGQGAVNKIDTHQGTPPVVEVRDENDRPVEGATVVFRLPPNGPGAMFPGQALSRTLRTNVQGQAIATGLTPNDLAGEFKIHVTATSGNKIGEIDIGQTNSTKTFAAHSKPRRKLPARWKLVAAGIGIAAVVVVVVLTTGGSSSTAAVVNPTITITPGPVTIGGR